MYTRQVKSTFVSEFPCNLLINGIDACCYGHSSGLYSSHLIAFNRVLKLVLLQHDARCVTAVLQKKTMPSEQTQSQRSVCAHVIMVLFTCCYQTPGGAPDGCSAQTNTHTYFLLHLGTNLSQFFHL